QVVHPGVVHSGAVQHWSALVIAAATSSSSPRETSTVARAGQRQPKLRRQRRARQHTRPGDTRRRDKRLEAERDRIATRDPSVVRPSRHRLI
ncbi:MAG TPA: hypothetical protein PLV68_04250, partial [Ilumatobacteraceae bacterium]|nr:hypothetical protein [Ilumatobacteraceae bacterium]